MIKRLWARTGILATGIAILAAAAAATISPSVAYAETVAIDTGAPVYASACRFCHGTLTAADDRESPVRFRHASHMTYACSSCHTAFPHRPEGTLLPEMRDCWACHGLTHGPQGTLAGAECAKCHTLAATLRPQSHTADWAETPHVAPAEEGLQTLCAMCHTQAQCDDCHRDLNIEWVAPEPVLYNPVRGCQACHGNPSLTKFAGDGVKSYHVTGLDASAHRDTGCIECHIDFSYSGPTPPTPLWQINVGLACEGCHDHEESAAEYADSVHARLIAEGDFTSATCASCHGGHDIERLDTDAAMRRLHFASEQMCADCHRAEWDSYNDYYHGAAYKTGAADAPACWDCHGSHDIRELDDPESAMYPVNAVEVCGECHAGSDESFIEYSAELIHGRAAVRDDNPIIKFVRGLRGGRD